MVLTLAIPDDLVERLNADGGNAARRVLESFAVEEYRAGRLSRPELRRLLGFETRYELDGFLKQRDIYDDVTVADVERELADLDRLGL